MRIRVVMVMVSGGLLALFGLLLAALSWSNPATRSLSDLAVPLGLVVVAAVCCLLMWWQVRRYRNNPAVRRRQPNPRAAKILLWGNLTVLLLGGVARGLSPVGGWVDVSLGFAVVLVGSFVVYRLAQRQDPRLHFWRRPDPLPEGQEPETEPVQKPW